MASVAPVLKELFDKDNLRNDCSGFFKALVNDKLKMGMPNFQADPLIDQIVATWIKIPGAHNPGADAARFAAQGYLVVALLKAADHQPHKDGTKYTHGHLSIVLPDAPPPDGFPYVIGGSTVADGQSNGSKRVRGVWRGVDAPNVAYYRTREVFPQLTPPAFK
jgi:hypothetical protein